MNLEVLFAWCLHELVNSVRLRKRSELHPHKQCILIATSLCSVLEQTNVIGVNISRSLAQ